MASLETCSETLSLKLSFREALQGLIAMTVISVCRPVNPPGSFLKFSCIWWETVNYLWKQHIVTCNCVYIHVYMSCCEQGGQPESSRAGWEVRECERKGVRDFWVSRREVFLSGRLRNGSWYRGGFCRAFRCCSVWSHSSVWRYIFHINLGNVDVLECFSY